MRTLKQIVIVALSAFPAIAKGAAIADPGLCEVMNAFSDAIGWLAVVCSVAIGLYVWSEAQIVRRRRHVKAKGAERTPRPAIAYAKPAHLA
jgi:hypothetical protein